MKDFDFSYKGDMAIIGGGGISENLINQVHRVLEKDFGFVGVFKYVNANVERIKPFLDGEVKWNSSKEDINQLKGKKVYVLQNMKVFDNRLEYSVQDLEKRIKELGINDSELNRIVNELFYYSEPDMTNMIAPRFISSRFNPSAVEKQLAGIIKAAKIGGSASVSLVIPKTVYEWSHHWLEKWHDDDKFEIPGYHDFLEHMNVQGMDSAVIFNPHAPKENLDVSRSKNFNSVMVFPQTFSLSSNGWIYSIDSIFKEYGVDLKKFDPIRTKVEKDVENLGDMKGLKHLLVYSSSVDEGSRFNAENAAKRFGLGYVRSAKNRQGEGSSTIKRSDDISVYLNELKSHTNEATIRIYLFDDMVNFGGTTNKEAKLRKDQIKQFNKENGTNYKVEVEAVLSHVRCPELSYLSHEYVDKIVVFDSVQYLPSLDKQLDKFGLSDKFEVLKETHKQLAMGIVFDYLLQNVHEYLENHHISGSYREITDKIMVKKKGYGLDMTNMTEQIEKIQDKENGIRNR
jgi:hypothetical protein